MHKATGAHGACAPHAALQRGAATSSPRPGASEQQHRASETLQECMSSMACTADLCMHLQVRVGDVRLMLPCGEPRSGAPEQQHRASGSLHSCISSMARSAHLRLQVRVGDVRLMLPCGEAPPPESPDLGPLSSSIGRLGASLPPEDPEDAGPNFLDFATAARGPTICVLILGAFHASTLHPGGSQDANDATARSTLEDIGAHAVAGSALHKLDGAINRPRATHLFSLPIEQSEVLGTCQMLTASLTSCRRGRGQHQAALGGPERRGGLALLAALPLCAPAVLTMACHASSSRPQWQLWCAGEDEASTRQHSEDLSVMEDSPHSRPSPSVPLPGLGAIGSMPGGLGGLYRESSFIPGSKPELRWGLAACGLGGCPASASSSAICS